MFYKIVTYGCQMNVHESEKIAGILEGLGYSALTDASQETDIIVFNTCCIRDTAEKRALGNIGVVKADKKRNADLIIAVVGCMTQQDGTSDVIKTRYPYVDIVLGTRNIAELECEIKKVKVERDKKRKNDKKYRHFSTLLPENYLETDEALPQTRTSFPNAWINIIYGCNNFCTYCIVPHVRGRELSRNPESVLEEIKRCVDAGYKEITLLGQNVNSYCGKFNGNQADFSKLLNEIDKIEGKFRVRFMTSHPKDLSDDIIAAMAESDKICKNLHLPVQAGSDKVLKDMNRKYNRAHYLEVVDKLRRAMPSVGLTTDIMVGFPTETEKDFEDTLALVEAVKFSSAFTFIFSPRKGTPAAEMPQIPYSVKQERIGRLIKAQNEITKAVSKSYIGGIYEVLAEDIAPKHSNMLCGRTDCGRLVTFCGLKEDIGKFFNVKITEARSASLFGISTDKI